MAGLSSLPWILADVIARIPKPRFTLFTPSCREAAAVASGLRSLDVSGHKFICETIYEALQQTRELNLSTKDWSQLLKNLSSLELNPLKLITVPITANQSTALTSHDPLEPIIAPSLHRLFTPPSSLLMQTRQYSTTRHVQQTVYGNRSHQTGGRHANTVDLSQLQNSANRLPRDAGVQHKYLEVLLRNDPSKVISHVESMNYNCYTQDCLEVYKQAISVQQSSGSPPPKTYPSYAGRGRQQSGTGDTFWPSLILFAAKGALALLLFGAFYAYILPKVIMKEKKDFTSEIPKENFEDVAGIDSAVEEMKQLVSLLGDTTKFSDMGCNIPKGYLLTGRPGTGKTLLAKALAGEANVPFFHASGSDFDEMFVGVGASRMRKLFEAAKAVAPSIIFIDEIDTIGGKRSGFHNGVYKGTLNQLLTEMDGFEDNMGVIVLAATNMPEKLDPALLRAGRFDNKIAIRPPNKDGRHEILKVHTFNKNLSPDVDLEDIAKATPGMTGSDLATLVNTAAIRAVSQGKPDIDQDDLEFGRAKSVMGGLDLSVTPSKAEKMNTAYHEAGHAAMILIQKSSKLSIYIATIQARGQSLGHVFPVPTEDQYSESIDDLIAHIDICLGGRVGEELYLGERGKVTTGCSQDMTSATRTAEKLVCMNGYSSKLGYARFDDTEFKSDQTNQLIQEEIKALLDERFAYVRKELKKYETNWRRLSEKLLEYETLTGEECKLVWDGYQLARGPEDGIPSSAAR